MHRIFLTASLAVFLCLPIDAAHAAACVAMDELIAKFAAENAPLHEFTDGEMPSVIEAIEAQTGRNLGPASRAFIVLRGETIIVSIEIDGCTIDPIVIASELPERLSGKAPDGRIGA